MALETTPTSTETDPVGSLARLLRGRSFVALTGAGCSTESGIPDYRGPETLRRARNPIRWDAYANDPAARARYWARSMVGWPRMAAAAPNDAHRALAALETSGALRGVITQNVDGLHHAAGSRRVIELHGALARVVCLACGSEEDRAALQERLRSLNPAYGARDGEMAPDGDMEVAAEALAGFRVAECRACAGVLKPDVVFFGENVPRRKVEDAFALLEGADALLVVGSSLAVYSGLRFVRRAEERGIPVAIVNLGPSRGDGAARVRVEGRAGEVLPALARALADAPSD